MQRFSDFTHLLEEQAKNLPDHPSLFYEDDGTCACITYARLLELCREKAAGLKSTGKTCLGVLCDGSLQCVLTVFGSVLAGLQTVLLDENAPEELLQEQICTTDVDILWMSEELKEELSLTAGKGLTGDFESVQARKGRMLFFTSGTTESSKAVVLTDKSLMSSAWNGGSMLPLSKEDRLMCMLPLNHVFGFVCSLLWGLSCGASVSLGRGARHYADDLMFFRPTALSAIPLLLGFLLKAGALNPELREILVGAGNCSRELLGAVASKGIHVSFGYGLTETSSGVAMSTSGDPYALEICPDDTIRIASDGEILIQAPACMMQGYYKRPEETEKVLKDGILYSGDLGQIDENGRLHLTGRKKEILVLSDGTKIFLPEYEAGIREVLGELDFAVAEKGSAPVLVVCADASLRPALSEKLKPVMARLPRGQQLRDILFVKDPLPRTATGKIRRSEIRI